MPCWNEILDHLWNNDHFQSFKLLPAKTRVISLLGVSLSPSSKVSESVSRSASRRGSGGNGGVGIFIIFASMRPHVNFQPGDESRSDHSLRRGRQIAKNVYIRYQSRSVRCGPQRIHISDTSSIGDVPSSAPYASPPRPSHYSASTSSTPADTLFDRTTPSYSGQTRLPFALCRLGSRLSKYVT